MCILKPSYEHCYRERTDCQHAIIPHVDVVGWLFAAYGVWPHFEYGDFSLSLLHCLM